MIRFLFVFSLCALLFGCASQKSIISNFGNDGSAKSLVQLDPNKTIYITFPSAKLNQNISTPAYALKVSEAIQKAFEPYVKNIGVAKRSQTDLVNLQRAKQGGYVYLVEPTIDKWSDNRTFWTGVPDEVEIEIDVFDTATGELVDHFDITGTSSLMPSINFKPYELLSEPLNRISAQLFKASSKHV